MEPHMIVTATATAPWGEATDVYIGSLPVWAWDDKGSRKAWTKVRRAVALDSLGTSGIGWRVTFTAVPLDES